MSNRSQVYTKPAYNARFESLRSANNRSGIIVDAASGDLTPEAIYITVASVRLLVWEALGFLDVLDIEQQAIKGEILALRQQVTDLKQDLSGIRQELSAVRTDFASLQQSFVTISNFLGVTIPNWTTKEEVENGDEMGVAYLGAAALGLTVNYIFDQRRPGYDHEQVISIDPPAGTLVARGSTITVTINLEG